jgi:hypothetical protein
LRLQIRDRRCRRPACLEIEDVDDESVAGLGTVDEEGTGERIVDLDVGERIAGLLESVAETVEGVGVEDVAGPEVGNGLRGAEGGFDVVHGGVEAHDISDSGVRGILCARRSGQGRQREKGCDQDER